MSKVLNKLLKANEGDQLDYKLTISAPAKIAKTLASFANHLGGIVAVGIRDDKSLIGIDPEEEKFQILVAANQYVSPPLKVEFEVIYTPDETEVEEEMAFLLVKIAQSDKRPHYVISNTGEKKAYIRQADRCIPASQVILRQLQKGTYNPTRFTKDLRIKDSNGKRVLAHLEKHSKITAREACKRFNLSERRANRLFQQMVTEGWLRVHDHDKEVYFTR